MGVLKIQAFELGPFATNCYLVSDGAAGFVVDASFEPQELTDAAHAQGVTVSDIILTHAHCDHIAGLDIARRELGRPNASVHPLEAEWLGEPQLNLSAFLGEPVSVAPAEKRLRGGDILTLAGREWNVLDLPGHSPGSVGLYSPRDGVILSGDALFAGSIGRTDFPGSSFDVLAASIREKLYTLPDDTKVYPGHGPPTTVGREKKSNPFVRA